jgi:alginate O-acetyltransferase complex protein AlgI
MLFVEFRFFWFFLVVFCVYWSLRENRSRKVWLLVCSYIFYAAWNWKFLFLLMGSSLLDYIVGMMLARTENPRARRGWLILSLAANLGTIALFKYYNFFVTSAAALLAWLGLPASIHTLNIIIPVGVSFYTFHSMSYTIDVYRGKMRAVPSLLDVACFIGFFPQMVAGPIVRAFAFLPQLQSLRKFSEVDVRGALVLFLTGFIKKACIADALALSVDRYFAAPWSFDTTSAWIAVLFYAIQIYCDFSGYTDMAIACARLLGYELTINFRFPYFSRDLAEFWTRWHISLSSWLRDYLFLSLGGARGTHWFAYRNIMITMLLGGLWHGAAWTFVIFGALHGAGLIIHHEWKRWTRKIPALRAAVWWIACPLTFYWVCLSMVFFRSGDLSRTGTVLRSFVLFSDNGVEQLGVWKLWIVLALGFLHWLNSRGTFANWWRRGPDPVFAAAYGCAAATVLLFIPQHYTPFIYFQF